MKTQARLLDAAAYFRYDLRMTVDLKRKFQNALTEFRIMLSQKQTDDFLFYIDFLKQESKKHNLTGLSNDDDIIEKHFIDSLTVLNVVDFRTCASLLDVGTGAGFPGIPLKIVFPGIALFLLETSSKKMQFIESLLNKLQLRAEILHGRAESFAKNLSFREHFTHVTARAFGSLSETLECTLPFAELNGNVVLYLGRHNTSLEGIKNAEAALKLLGGTLQHIHFFKLPSTGAERTFVIVKKTAPTSEKYPRKPGIPHKRPLF